ncbi:MAG: flagellar biosynthetic protein FliO [Mycetocola sp.]
MDTVFVALRVILSLAAVLALLWYAQRRIGRGRKAGRAAELVTVVGRQGIGLKASVVVVDVDGTRFLLGVTEHAVTVLNSNDAPAAPPMDAAPPLPDFATALAGVTSIDVAAEHRLRPRRNQQPAQAGGSILSPATWKQTAAALRQIR